MRAAFGNCSRLQTVHLHTDSPTTIALDGSQLEKSVINLGIAQVWPHNCVAAITSRPSHSSMAVCNELYPIKVHTNSPRLRPHTNSTTSGLEGALKAAQSCSPSDRAMVQADCHPNASPRPLCTSRCSSSKWGPTRSSTSNECLANLRPKLLQSNRTRPARQTMGFLFHFCKTSGGAHLDWEWSSPLQTTRFGSNYFYLVSKLQTSTNWVDGLLKADRGVLVASKSWPDTAAGH